MRVRLAPSSSCHISAAPCVTTNEMKKHGGSRLLNASCPDLHNRHSRAGTGHVCLKILPGAWLAGPRQARAQLTAWAAGQARRQGARGPSLCTAPESRRQVVGTRTLPRAAPCSGRVTLDTSRSSSEPVSFCATWRRTAAPGPGSREEARPGPRGARTWPRPGVPSDMRVSSGGRGGRRAGQLRRPVGVSLQQATPVPPGGCPVRAAPGPTATGPCRPLRSSHLPKDTGTGSGAAGSASSGGSLDLATGSGLAGPQLQPCPPRGGGTTAGPTAPHPTGAEGPGGVTSRHLPAQGLPQAASVETEATVQASGLCVPLPDSGGPGLGTALGLACKVHVLPPEPVGPSTIVQTCGSLLTPKSTEGARGPAWG